MASAAASSLRRTRPLVAARQRAAGLRGGCVSRAAPRRARRRAASVARALTTAPRPARRGTHRLCLGPERKLARLGRSALLLLELFLQLRAPRPFWPSPEARPRLPYARAGRPRGHRGRATPHRSRGARHRLIAAHTSSLSSGRSSMRVGGRCSMTICQMKQKTVWRKWRPTRRSRSHHGKPALEPTDFCVVARYLRRQVRRAPTRSRDLRCTQWHAVAPLDTWQCCATARASRP